MSTLLNFQRMFNRAHDENTKQIEQEMKKAAENDHKSKMGGGAPNKESANPVNQHNSPTQRSKAH